MSDDDSSPNNCKIDLTKLKAGPPYTCQTLFRTKNKEKFNHVKTKTYTLDITEANKFLTFY